MAIIRVRYYYCPDFTDKEIEAQRRKYLVPSHMPSKCQNKDLNPSSLALEPLFLTTVLCTFASLSLETVGTLLASVRWQKPVAKWQRECRNISY